MFQIELRLGLTAWLAAATHEVPQELGDLSVQIHGGWRRGSARGFNLLSGSIFLLGTPVAWPASRAIDVGFLVSLAAGNFIHIAASDLVPEVNQHNSLRACLLHFLSFAAGLVVLWGLREALAACRRNAPPRRLHGRGRIRLAAAFPFSIPGGEEPFQGLPPTLATGFTAPGW